MALYVIILYMFHSKSSSIFLFIKLYSGVLLILIDLISSLTFFCRILYFKITIYFFNQLSLISSLYCRLCFVRKVIDTNVPNLLHVLKKF